jgi:TCP-1/cpn60 chaperonin family
MDNINSGFDDSSEKHGSFAERNQSRRKDVLNEMERNLQDAMTVVRNMVYQPKLVPGGGAVEIYVSPSQMNAPNLVQRRGHSGSKAAIIVCTTAVSRHLAVFCDGGVVICDRANTPKERVICVLGLFIIHIRVHSSWVFYSWIPP